MFPSYFIAQIIFDIQNNNTLIHKKKFRYLYNILYSDIKEITTIHIELLSRCYAHA